MLKARVLTAAILVPLVIWAVLSLPLVWFAAAAGVVILAGAWEWTRLVPINKTLSKIMFMLFILAALVTVFPLARDSSASWQILIIALLWWAGVCLWLFVPQAGQHLKALKIGAAMLCLIPSWYALVVLHGHADFGPEYVLFLLILVWVADSAAYFTGKRFGRHRLIPKVSPGKSWEGVIGGLFGSGLVALAATQLLDWQGERMLWLIGLSILVAVLSIIGDLNISLLKRQQQLKDTGHLFPGHGGMLDRIDSLTSAAPLFLFGLMWLEA